MNNFLFMHGWATDKSVWLDNINEIANGAAINISLPGHGGAFKWDKPDFSPAVKEINNAISNEAEGSLIGIGWSLGAQALISAIAEGTDKFRALVLAGASPCFAKREGWTAGASRALVKRMIKDMKADPSATLDRFCRLNFTSAELNTPQAQSFISRYKYPGPIDCSVVSGSAPPACAPVLKYGELTSALEALLDVDLRGVLPAINIPCLIIHGGADSVCPVEAGTYLAEKIKGARLEVIPGAGHAPFLTRMEFFNALVNAFAEKLPQ